MITTDQSTKYRSLLNFRMLQPHFQPSHRRARQICHSPLSLRVRLAAPDQRLAGAVRMEINVSDLERHKLAATGEGFVGNTEHGPLTIRAQAFAGALDELLDVLPAQGMRLVLACRGFSSHLLQTQSHGFTRAGIQ